MRKLPLILLALLLCCLLPAQAEEVPYRQRVARPDEMIFSEPGYDGFCTGTVRKAGVYTIVEEVDDGGLDRPDPCARYGGRRLACVRRLCRRLPAGKRLPRLLDAGERVRLLARFPGL